MSGAHKLKIYVNIKIEVNTRDLNCMGYLELIAANFCAFL